MKNRTEFEKVLAQYKVPKKYWDCLHDYYFKGIAPKNKFVFAIIANNLVQAIENGPIEHLEEVTGFVYKALPNEIVGSYQNIEYNRGVHEETTATTE